MRYYYSQVSVHMADSITSSLNDSSLVFYRVNEHIHKKVPLLVQEKVRVIIFFAHSHVTMIV